MRRLPPAPFAFLDSLHGAPAFLRTKTPQRTSPLVREAFVAPRPVAGVLEKNVPELLRARGHGNCLRLWWFPPFDTLAVASTLAVAFLLATRRRSVLLLRLPPRPLPRFLPARRAAIALARLPRMKTMLTAFKQTAPGPRCGRRSLPSRLTCGDRKSTRLDSSHRT